MEDKIKEDNIDNEFTDINKESKYKPYIIVGILYLLVIILSVILILGLKHQKDTINNSMNNENNNPVDNNVNNNTEEKINQDNHDDNVDSSQDDNKLGNNNINQDDSSILDYIN